MRMLTGISEIADNFDYFIIDLWGVLHDGVKPYPGAVECLKNLREKKNKKILLLSNAPRKSFKAVETLSRVGFSRDLYDEVITSGQVAFDYLKNTNEFGKKYYYIGPDRDADILEGSDYEMCMSPKDSDFCLVTGFDNFGDGIETKIPQVQKCLKEDLPMVCVNPDKIVVKQTGEIMLCAGLLAEFYEKNGGQVTYFGKPYKITYDRCFEYLRVNDTKRICAIGDGLHTDIKGANNADIFSILVAGGILAKDLGIKPGETPNQKKLEKLCDTEDAYPSAVISSFLW